jgi:hypothetical protein
MYGSGMGDGNVHSKNPISSLLVGGANGKLEGGRHIRAADNTPHSNVLAAVLNIAGIPTERIGNGTGVLAI